MMMKLRTPAALALAIGVAVTAALIGVVGAQTSGSGRFVISPDGIVDEDTGLIFSRTRVFEFDDEILRFDSATGETFVFVGTVSGASATGTWRLRVRAVREPTSGFLELQRAGDGIFLIDVVTGDTWVLRQREGISAWMLVRPIGG